MIEVGPATIADLKRELPNSTAEFREEMLELEATIEDAKTLWIDRQSKALAEKEAELAKAREEAAQATAKKAGVEPVGVGTKQRTGDAGDPIAEFNRRVNETIRDYSIKRHEAVRKVFKADPELREAYVEATNAKRVVAERP